jgi:hypothetical protein
MRPRPSPGLAEYIRHGRLLREEMHAQAAARSAAAAMRVAREAPDHQAQPPSDTERP